MVAEGLQERLGEFGASLAIGTGVGGAGSEVRGDAEDKDTGDGTDTGLGLAQGLGKPCPESDGGGIDLVIGLGEVDRVLIAELLDEVFVQDIGERESLAVEERRKSGVEGRLGVRRQWASLVSTIAWERRQTRKAQVPW